VRDYGVVVVTILLFLLVGGWLFVVGAHVGTSPHVNKDGSVLDDAYQRSKDVLALFIPLLTTAVGFWFGSQGTAKAQDAATKATGEANQAKAALLAVVDTSQSGVLAEARRVHPAAFAGPLAPIPEPAAPHVPS
jgi:hypothetical protein